MNYFEIIFRQKWNNFDFVEYQHKRKISMTVMLQELGINCESFRRYVDPAVRKKCMTYRKTICKKSKEIIEEKFTTVYNAIVYEGLHRNEAVKKAGISKAYFYKFADMYLSEEQRKFLNDRGRTRMRTLTDAELLACFQKAYSLLSQGIYTIPDTLEIIKRTDPFFTSHIFFKYLKKFLTEQQVKDCYKHSRAAKNQKLIKEEVIKEEHSYDVNGFKNAIQFNTYEKLAKACVKDILNIIISVDYKLDLPSRELYTKVYSKLTEHRKKQLADARILNEIKKLADCPSLLV